MFTNPGPFSFGRTSTAQLETLHPDLRRVLERAIRIFDFSITEGRRTIEAQIANLRRGASKTIDSRHIPRDDEGVYQPDGWSEAADVVPYQRGVNPWPQPRDSAMRAEKKARRFYFMAGILYAIARQEDVDIRLGVDWDGDLDFFDQKFDDLGHVELRTDRAELQIPEDLQEDVEAALGILVPA